MKYLRFYYYKYLYDFDPVHSWFYHCIKVIVAAICAMTLTLYEHQNIAVWIIIPTVLMSLMVDVESSLKSRAITMLNMWWLSLACVSLIMLMVDIPWLRIVTFLLLALGLTTLANFKPRWMKTVVLSLLFMLIELRFKFGTAALPMTLLNFAISLVITSTFVLLIFPNRLLNQCQKLEQVTYEMVVRYYIFSLENIAVGQYSVKRWYELQCKAHNALIAYEEVIDNYAKQKNADAQYQRFHQLQQMFENMMKLHNLAQSLTVKAYFSGPLKALADYGVMVRTTGRHFLKHEQASTTELEQAMLALKRDIAEKSETLKANISTVSHDFKYWNLVYYTIESINSSLLLFLRKRQGD